MKDLLPEEKYVAALLDEFQRRAHLLQQRPIISIFFGGGTPSLFSGKAIGAILEGIAQHAVLAPDVEITLEANPGTIDQARFGDFRHAGVNRLSIGIQSLQNDKLKKLGRIHDRDHAMQAIQYAKKAGFDNFNLDIMFGLPNQSMDEALADIRDAIAFEPTHFSWYQLTIEPNTLFYRERPTLPVDDLIWEMQLAGQALLKEQGFQQYEISAYSQTDRNCKHNRNYWEFGDYLGIGAGAHSKITKQDTGEIIRFAQVRHPKDYLDAEKRQVFHPNVVQHNEIIFEFMLNALRLTDGVTMALFTKHTGLPVSVINEKVTKAIQLGLLIDDNERLRPTEKGLAFLNDLTGMFLAD
jgi:putative oxygen-independent coproporphyrinogen III oxidase